jgi:hypothetical protein
MMAVWSRQTYGHSGPFLVSTSEGDHLYLSSLMKQPRHYTQEETAGLRY